MSPEWIIGALAFVTIGGTVVVSVLHFGIHLRDPENRDAAKRVAADLEPAATRASSEGINGRSLRQRLNEAPRLDDRLGNRPRGVGPWAVMVDVGWPDLGPMLQR